MGKILIFYKYVAITYPEQIRKWQEKICKQINVTGRIIIAHEGINATLGGTQEAIATYIQEISSHPLFQNIDFKQSPGGRDFFPRLRIVIKNEITHLGLDPQVVTVQQSGQYLTPEQAHALMKSKPEELVILDARNNYESRIGKFEHAVTPDITNFRDFPGYIDQNLDLFKDKEVLMYCTAGIRCERGSSYLNSKKIAKKVYHIEGGIQRYVEKFPNGFFRGKNYVFDGRIAVKVTDDVLSTCDICTLPFDDYTNCLNAECNKQYIACDSCLKNLGNTCSLQCMDLVANKKVVIRKIPKKVTLPAINTK